MLILVLSSLPYLAGYYSETPEAVFSGAAFDRMDYAVHLATMHLGARGEWTYHFRFTGEPHDGTYVKLFYIFLGHIARWFNLGLETAYQLGRVVFGLAALVGIYLLMSEVFESVFIRRIAFLIAVLGSGLGWLQMIISWQPTVGISPIDFWLMDAYVFFGLVVFPHYMAITALLAFGILFYLRFVRRRIWWNWTLSVFAALAVIAIQPFSIVMGNLAMAGAVAGKWFKKGSAHWNDLWPLVLAFVLQLPFLIYNLYVYRNLPVWSQISGQHIMLSPPLPYYLFGFGLLWLLVLSGGWTVIRKRLSPGFVALFWIVGALILCYFPVAFQRRFIGNIVVPMGLLAGYALDPNVSAILPFQSTPVRNSLSLLVVVLVIPSTLYISSGGYLFVSQRPAVLFDPGATTRAVGWLAANTNPDQEVLAAQTTSYLVAAKAGLPVFSGHPMETLNFSQKENLVKSFYAGEFSPEEAVSWLYDTGVQWVIFGSEEQSLGGKAELPFGRYLQLAYEGDGVSIYRVLP
jgi:hypothetical protein